MERGVRINERQREINSVRIQGPRDIVRKKTEYFARLFDVDCAVCLGAITSAINPNTVVSISLCRSTLSLLYSISVFDELLTEHPNTHLSFFEANHTLNLPIR